MSEIVLVTLYLLLVYYIGVFWDETDDEVVARFLRWIRNMLPPMRGVIFVPPDKQCPRCRDRRFREWLKIVFAKTVTMNLTCYVCGSKYSRAERRQEIM